MNRYKIKKQSSGFTMIEIMVVVVIVAILAAIAVPTYVRYVESARASEAKSVIGNIDNAAKMYFQTYTLCSNLPWDSIICLGAHVKCILQHLEVRPNFQFFRYFSLNIISFL